MLACLILDLHMSGMDGLRLQRHLADAGYRVPIIVLTADGDSETRARAMNEGAVAFLTKPFDSDLLLAEVRSEEHTSELQSLMRISYAVFCLNKKNTNDKK